MNQNVKSDDTKTSKIDVNSQTLETIHKEPNKQVWSGWMTKECVMRVRTDLRTIYKLKMRIKNRDPSFIDAD